MRRAKIYSSVLLVVAAISGPKPGWAADEPPQVTQQLKAAVEQVQKNIPDIQPWQKKLFDDEVVPQYQRFIRDYRPSAQGLNVEVDQATIKDYIRFYAVDALKVMTPKIVVFLRTDSNEKTQGSYESIKALVKARLERRGFWILWLTPEDLRDPTLSGKPLNDYLMDYVQKKNLAAAFAMYWNLLPPDDADSAHADENHYQLASFLQIKDSPRIEGRAELLDSDNFEHAAARLITDAMTETGKRMSTVTASTVAAERDEFTIEVAGIREFPLYAKIKSVIADRIQEFGTIEERRLSRGKAVFALFTKKSLAEIRGILEAQIGERKLALIGASDRTIQMEIR